MPYMPLITTTFYRATPPHVCIARTMLWQNFRPSVCLSARPSHAGILSKRLHISLNLVHYPSIQGRQSDVILILIYVLNLWPYAWQLRLMALTLALKVQSWAAIPGGHVPPVTGVKGRQRDRSPKVCGICKHVEYWRIQFYTNVTSRQW